VLEEFGTTGQPKLRRILWLSKEYLREMDLVREIGVIKDVVAVNHRTNLSKVKGNK